MSFFNGSHLDVNGLEVNYPDNYSAVNVIISSNYMAKCTTDVVTGGATTLTVGNIMDGKLTRSAAFIHLSFDDTTPTAAAIVTEMKVRDPDLVVNTGFELVVYFAPDLAIQVYGLLPGTGCFVQGDNDIKQNKAQICTVIATNITSGSEEVKFIWCHGQS